MHSLPPLLLLVLVLLAISSQSDGYNTGAPKTACDAMIPQHGSNPQTTAFPVDVNFDETSVPGGSTVSVTLQDKGAEFKGFLVQARNSSGVPIGSFSTTSGYNKVSCDSEEENAVTHKTSNGKSKVDLKWTAPFDFEGDVKFRVSIVQSFTTYWVGHESKTLSVQKRSAPAVSVSETTPVGLQNDVVPDLTQTTAAEPEGISKSLKYIYNDCGTLKSCLGLPAGCEKDEKCRTLVTYTKSGGKQYEFELKVKAPNGRSKFVGVGLSLDEKMGDDSVVLCTVHNNEVDVRMTWNVGTQNVDIIDPKLGLTILESGVFDGELYCRFHRAKMTEIKAKKFDLDGEKFHVMLAEGALSSDGKPTYHGNPNRIVSQRPVSLGLTSNLEVRDERLFRMIHGSLMIGAWICTASIGMLFARYYKQTWLQAKCCGLDQWFHYHRFFMIFTWCLTMAGFILIVVELKEFRPSNHAWIGLSSVVLCFIQPFMAMLRPHPGTKRRPLFNWAHWFVGNAAQILGVTAIFFGLEFFFGVERNWVKEVGWYILVVFIGFHCVIHLILTISQCIGDQRTAANDIFPLKELTDSRAPLQPETKRRDAPLSCFRKFILALYLPVNWFITALLILIIVVKREHIEIQLVEWGLPEFWEE